MFDTSVSVSHVMAPFIWDGSRTLSGTMKVAGERPPHEPFDLFGRPFVEHVAPRLLPDDRVRIGTFSRLVRLSDVLPTGAGLSGTIRKILAVPRSERSGPSPVWDAINEAVRLLETEGGRRAVIVVTDGRSTGNRISLTTLLGRLRGANVPVHIILVNGLRLGSGFRLVDSTANPWMTLTPLLGRQPEEALGDVAHASAGSLRIDSSGGTQKVGPLMAELFDTARQVRAKN
jgi:hypothetical protein